MGKRKYNYEYVKNYVENVGYKLISIEYFNVEEKIEIQCLSCNKNWFTSFSSFLNGHRCPRCSRLKYDLNFMKNFFDNNEFKLLSEEYIDVTTNMILMDKEGYKYSVSYRCFKARVVDQNETLSKFGRGNPFTIDNVKNFIDINFSGTLFLKNNEVWKNSFCLMDFYDDCGYFYKVSFVTIQTAAMRKNGYLLKFSDTNPYTIDNIKKYLLINNSILKLDDNQKWNGARSPMIFTDNEGYKYMLPFNNVQGSTKKNLSFSKFEQSNIFVLDNISNYLKLNNKTFSLIEGQQYFGNNKKLKFKCNICRDDELPFLSTWANIMRGNNCSICSGTQIGKYNNLEVRYPNIALEWDYKKNYPINPSDVFPGTSKKYYWICPGCNKSYYSSPNARIYSMTSCPRCNRPHGEKILSMILEEYKRKNIIVNFVSQHIIKECKDRRPLKFDFFVDTGKFFVAIEFNGVQHTKSIDFFGGQEKFEDRVKKDNIKRDFCKNNNIKLIEIFYDEMNKISEILKLELEGKEV